MRGQAVWMEFGSSSAVSMSLSRAAWTRPVASARLLRAATNIPARLGVRFGFRYALQGSPVGARVPIEIVMRYPHPGIPRNGRLVSEHRYSVEMPIGAPQYTDFQFDEPEELVPGIWVMELWSADRKLGEQQFCVGSVDAPRHHSCNDVFS